MSAAIFRFLKTKKGKALLGALILWAFGVLSTGEFIPLPDEVWDAAGDWADELQAVQYDGAP